MDELKLALLAAAVALIVTGGIVGCRIYETRAFVTGGYCQDTVKGGQGLVWIKCAGGK